VKQYGGDVTTPLAIYEVQPEYTELARTDKVHPNIWRLERVGRLPRVPTQRTRQRRDGWAYGCLASYDALFRRGDDCSAGPGGVGLPTSLGLGGGVP
jgi:hypothetical protein